MELRSSNQRQRISDSETAATKQQQQWNDRLSINSRSSILLTPGAATTAVDQSAAAAAAAAAVEESGVCRRRFAPIVRVDRSLRGSTDDPSGSAPIKVLPLLKANHTHNT
eukprot:CAMPEP_0201265624 /NCGR_PEP_ID=MMETSP0853-20130426/15991_1 /ASSEMBLY_ACC=CAM_ASM_000640 /TAXON_ID=183588 /ORGANISM="Pseudo-nitzschia fraudulenta, Strain WWA7" /LENGTH=109 /DNA_ID=CAMNT_0047570143 /DNA_START=154 /DNA_END=479 /DNA_ORIENTATION=+